MVVIMLAECSRLARRAYSYELGVTTQDVHGKIHVKHKFIVLRNVFRKNGIKPRYEYRSSETDF